MTGLPGRSYAPCSQCGRLVQVYPVDRALVVWPGAQVVCRTCADGPHEDDRGEEE